MAEFSGKLGIAVVVVAVAALAGAIGYRTIAARPSAEAAPAAANMQPSSTAELEKRVADKPDDAEAWKLLGERYVLANRFVDAAAAYARAATLVPTRPELWSALGEARVLADGAVGAEAHRAFATALSIDPRDFRARYFLGVEKDMAGDHKRALEDWIALANDAPPGAPWESSVRTLIAQVAAREKIDVAGRLKAAPAAPPPGSGEALAAAAIPGPTREQMAAASGLTPSQQDEMVQGMVGRLAARLAADPNDADGWVRLMRARMVLKDNRGAGDALVTARKTFAAPTPARKQIDDAAAMLGVPGA